MINVDIIDLVEEDYSYCPWGSDQEGVASVVQPAEGHMACLAEYRLLKMVLGC